MYRVIRSFYDSTDNNRLYKKGDDFPAAGVDVGKRRINSLLNGKNKTGKIYIEEVAETEDEKGEGSVE